MPDFEPVQEQTANIDESVAFLKKWKPEGPWILTSIAVDSISYGVDERDISRGTSTATFYPKGEDVLRQWLKRREARCGVYFQVNSTFTEDENGHPINVTKKIKKADVQSVDWFHIDIDPRVGHDLKSERNLALETLTNPPEGVPKPTVVIFSGGGFQGFWKLREPIHVEGDIGKTEEAERYNIQLRMALGGDECQNADRIMRLPGSVNVPNRKKLEKGRGLQRATLIEFDDEFVYSVSDFVPSPKLQEKKTGLGREEIRIQGNVERVPDLSKMKTATGTDIKLTDKTIDLVENGYDPSSIQENEARGLKLYESRSEALFSAVTTLIGNNVPPATVYSIITDRDYAISESVLEQGSRSEKYALRQIQRARDYKIAPELEELNELHAVILSDQGRCVVATEEYDHVLKRQRLIKSDPKQIERRYANRVMQAGTKANGDPRYEKLGLWWFENSARREYKGIVMSPEHEIEGHYNLWRGFSYEPKKGDCSLFLDHVRENICCTDEKYEYQMNWLARAVQKPAHQAKTAIVLQGEQGTGKTFFADSIGKLFGRHYLSVSDAELLLGRFNEHLKDCVFVFSDEAFFARNTKHQASLKSLITGDHFTVEAKYERPHSAKNFLHLILASNSEHVVPAELGDRRFFCLKVSDARRQDLDYFRAIQKQLDNGGYEALLYELLTRNIKGWNPENIPQTAALIEQKIISMRTEEKFIYEFLNDAYDFHQDIPSKEFFHRYISYCDDLKVRSERRSKQELFISMQKMFPSGYPSQRRIRVKRMNNQQKTCFNFPPLIECRAFFDKTFKGPFPWNSLQVESTEDEQAEMIAEPPF